MSLTFIYIFYILIKQVISILIMTEMLSVSLVVDRDLPVPQFSYSSSDEDDDYFDAADEIPTPAVQNHITLQV